MQAVRIIAWVTLLVAATLFAANNWTAVEVMIWEDIVLETKIPALMLLSFLLGFLPMWLVNHGTRWRMRRRIRSLENAAQSANSVLVPSMPPEPELIDNKPESL